MSTNGSGRGDLAALHALRRGCTHLAFAQLEIQEMTAPYLSDERAARAVELGTMIAEALAFATRLDTCVQGDIRAHNGSERTR